MPTVHRERGYRFYFLSGDRDEPPHLHIQGAGGFAKFWLSPVALASSANLGGPAIRRIQRIIEQRQAEFLESWNEFFAD